MLYETCRTGTFVFVDTPGISLNDDALRYKIKNLMDKIGTDEIHLVMNSNTKRTDGMRF